MNTPQVNQAKLMLLTWDVSRLCDQYRPLNDAEASATVGMFLTTAATIAAKIHGMPFSLPVIERLARAAQDGLNEAILGERK
jgi:hypothetical protein